MLDFWTRVRDKLQGDLTQSWLCQEIEVSSGTMSNWINKNRLPAADKAQAIASALDVTVEYLVSGKAEQAKASEVNLRKTEPTRVKATNAAPSTFKHINTPIISHKSDKGIPFYDIGATAHIAEVFEEAYTPQFHIQYEPFKGADLCMPVMGDSMEPTIFHGDVIALKKVHSFTHIEWGEIYVVTSYADRDLCAVKCIHQNQGDNNTILLRSLNPAFAGDTVVYKQDIHTIYKVIGLVRML